VTSAFFLHAEKSKDKNAAPHRTGCNTNIGCDASLAASPQVLAAEPLHQFQQLLSSMSASTFHKIMTPVLKGA
jgi:hypothetical protein